MVFSCFQNDSLRRNGDERREEYLLRVQEHLLAFVHSTSLNIIAWTLVRLQFEEECQILLDIYDKFLRLLDDKVTRNRLGKLDQDAYEDEAFLECRALSHHLQRILRHVCFEVDSALREFTVEYGVF